MRLGSELDLLSKWILEETWPNWPNIEILISFSLSSKNTMKRGSFFFS